MAKPPTLQRPSEVTRPRQPFDLGVAVEFSNVSVEPETYALTVTSPIQWLYKGASLMRASSALMRQIEADSKAIERYAQEPAQQQRFARQARIIEQALMLAAMAVEDALKGGIVARMPQPRFGETRDGLPDEIRHGHDLETLATSAGIQLATEDDTRAIRFGRYFIEYAGRYPTTQKPENNPDSYIHSGAGLHAIYRGLFLRCGDMIERQRANDPQRQSDFGITDPETWVAQNREALEALIAID